jgi:hypothetical protein
MEQTTRQIEWINSFDIPTHKGYLANRAEQIQTCSNGRPSAEVDWFGSLGGRTP